MMTTGLKGSTAKRSTNISLSPEVYSDAKRLGINLSQTCDRLLRQVIREEEAKQWAEQHAEFVETYNRVIEAEGLPLDKWRSF